MLSRRTALIALAATSLAACGLLDNGKPAPQVSFKTLTGKTFDTRSLIGQVTLVNFWATSCTTCVKEMPALVATYQSLAPQGYRTIAVAMAYDERSFLAPFVASRGIPFDVVFDADGAIARAFDDTKLTPTSYLIDKQGQIVKRYVGEIHADQLQAAVKALL